MQRDGSGPMGYGAMTGRGMGVCTGVNAPIYGGGFGRGFGRGFGGGYGRGYGRGFGLGYGRGFGGGFGQGYGTWPNANYNQTTSKEMLQAQKEQLENMLDAINKQIDG